MPPKVKVNVISEPSEDNVSYDAIVEASNVKQEENNLPQLLDGEDGVNTSQETHADDVGVVKKSRPKRSPKKKAVAAKEEDLLGCNPSEHGVRHEPQLLDNEDDVNTSQETHADDVGVVKKARPKRYPKKKAVAVGEASQLRYIDQFNAIECLHSYS